MNKLKRFKKFLSFLAVFIMVAQNLVSPVLADGYEVTEETEYNYEVIDGGTWGWNSDIFKVYRADDNSTYTALCLNPDRSTPPVGAKYSFGASYGSNDLVAKTWFFGCGKGQGYGPCSGLSYEGAAMITHHAISLAIGYDGWNGYGGNILGSEGAAYYDMAVALVDYASEHSLPTDYYAWAEYLTSDNDYQDLLIYDDWYTPPSHTDNYGKVDVNKVDINSGSNIKGAIFGVFFYKEDAEHATWNDIYGLGTSTGAWNYDYTNHSDHYAIINTGSGSYGISGDLWVGQDDDITENYYVKELKAPSGYKLDTNVYKVEVKKDQTVRCANIPNSNNFGNDGGRPITLTKVATNGKTNSETAEAGAQFQIKNSAGTVVDTITTDASGNGKSNILPYGTYTVHQIAGNKNALFVEDFIVELTPGETYALDYAVGKLADDETWITTTATDKNFGHTGSIASNAIVYDDVYLHNLEVGASYTIKGRLMNRANSQVVTDYNGNEVTAELSFVATSKNDTKTLTFTFDSRGLGNFDTVVFEKLYKGTEEVASEENVNVTSQQIHFDTLPEITTTATDANTGTQQSAISSSVTIHDDIKITNAVPGCTYTIKGKLVNRQTGEAIIDANGNAVTNEMQFIPANIDDNVARMSFTFNSTNLEGVETVVFEELYIGNWLACDEKNIDETSQMIFFPTAKTKAADYMTGTHVGSEESTKVVDHVTCSNLIVGKNYTIKGKLMNAVTGEPMVDADGNEITGETTFTATEKNPTVDVIFTFSAGLLKGKTTVVFEDVYHEGIKICTHSDLNDNDQKVSYGEMKTSAIDTDTKTQQGIVHKDARITDIVSYKNLIPGTYKVKGTLMDKATGLALEDAQGNKITGESTLVIKEGDEPTGTINVDFHLDTTKLGNKDIVVFEEVYLNDLLLIAELDINNEEQTVHYPDIHTTANDGVSGDKYNDGAEEITLIDTVKYNNLIVGKEYVVKGVLMDKSTGKALISKSTGKQITGETKFTATEKDGDIEVTFSLTRSDLVSRTVVVFEDLYNDEIEVFAHEDLNDGDQTIEYGTKFGIFKLDGTTKVKKVLSGATLQILDKDGKVVEIELITEKADKDGKVTVTKEKVTSFVSTDEETIIANLEPGTYKLHEVKAPWGYNLAEDVEFTLEDMPELQHFVIVDEGKVGTMVFSYNEKKDYEVAADSDFVPGPKTGDASNMFIYIMMLIVSGLMLFALALGKHKKAIIKVFGIMAVFMSIGMMSNSKVYADTNFTIDEAFESENKDATYEFDKTTKKNGEDYTLIDVKYDVAVKKIANITKTNKVLTTDAAPYFAETIVENGLTYKLKGTTKADANEMGNRAINYTKAYTYNGITKADGIPESVTEDVRDEATNEVRTVVMTRSNIVKSNEQVSDNFAFDVSVKSQAYYQYKDHVIEYNADDPNLMQYKDEILADLGLDSNIYTVESIVWTSEPVYDASEFVIRTATVKGYKSIADYEATYVATVDYPTSNVVYTAEYEADSTKNKTVYEIKATATYQLSSEIAGINDTVTEKSSSSIFVTLFKNPVVVGSFTVVVLLLVAILGFILIKKKSEKEIIK